MAERAECEPHPARTPGAGKGTQAQAARRRASASRRSRPATCCARRVKRGHAARQAGRGVHGRGPAGPRRRRDRHRRGAAGAARRRARASSSTASRAPSRRPRRSTRVLARARRASSTRVVVARRARRRRWSSALGGPAHLPEADGAIYHVDVQPAQARRASATTAAASSDPARRRQARRRSRSRLEEYDAQDRAAARLLPAARGLLRSVDGVGRASTTSSAAIVTRARELGAMIDRSRRADEIEQACARPASSWPRSSTTLEARVQARGDAPGSSNAIAERADARARARSRPSRATTATPRVALHLGQRGGGARHPAQGRGPQGRRHRRHRLRRLQGRLLRRLGAHRRRSATVDAEAAAAARRDRASRSRRAIEQCGPGNRLGDIGGAVQTLRRSRRAISVVRDFVGHGIGRRMHEEPAGPELRRRRATGRACQAGPGARHRADGERRGALRSRSWTTAGRR